MRAVTVNVKRTPLHLQTGERALVLAQQLLQFGVKKTWQCLEADQVTAWLRCRYRRA